jgi:hypothetical protein
MELLNPCSREANVPPFAERPVTALGVEIGGRLRGCIRGSSAKRARAQTTATSVPASFRPASFVTSQSVGKSLLSSKNHPRQWCLRGQRTHKRSVCARYAAERDVHSKPLSSRQE